MQANQNHFRDRRAFTLIEVLAVVAIIGLLLAAAVPIFSNTSNNARVASREIIKAHLQQARAHAIATGTSVAVAIPVLASDNELGARAVSLFEVELAGNSYVPAKDADGNERLLQRWETLPGNFHFLSSSQASIPKEEPTIIDSLPTDPKQWARSCHIIVFSPNGQIVRPDTEINIATAQAVNRSGSLVITQKSEGSPVIDLLHVNRLTGRIRLTQP